MKTRLLLTAITFFMFGCSGHEREYNFKMDYPVDAARLSLGGDIHVNIDCAKRKVNVISDSSNGIFSRHINKRSAISVIRKQISLMSYTASNLQSCKAKT
jgi:hypothetical protein